MKQTGEIITLFALVLMVIVSMGAAELRDYTYPIVCKTDNPEVNCEISRSK